MKGFWKSQAYIATQYPLEETTQDFWRMVWQENCRSLVMLLSKEELEQVIPYRPHPPPPPRQRAHCYIFICSLSCSYLLKKHRNLYTTLSSKQLQLKLIFLSGFLS